MAGELRTQAREDLKSAVQEEFGQQIRISRPDGSDPLVFIGNSNDVHVAINTENGDLIAGKTCQAVFILSEVLAHFGQLPANQPPWQVEFLEFSAAQLKVKNVMPDSSQDALVLIVGK